MHEDATVRRADLLRLAEIAAGVPVLDEDYLILSTIHSAKGVFVLNVVDGCIPSDLGTGTTAAIKEERRLLHVAMTRAKDGLHLVVPQRFFIHGQSTQGDRHIYAREQDSFRRPRCRCSNARRGQSPWPQRPPGRTQDRSASMSVRGCAVCGGEGAELCCHLYSPTKGQQATLRSCWCCVGAERRMTLRPVHPAV